MVSRFAFVPKRLRQSLMSNPLPKANKCSAKTRGFSEDALRGLEELDARMPPPDADTQPAFAPFLKHTERMSKEASAGGGLVTDSNGHTVPHYWGQRDRLRKRFAER